MQQVSSNAISGTLAKSGVGKRRFLISLLLATWLPIAFFILLAPSAEAGSGLAGIKAVFLFLGTAHVPATLFFYADREFAEIRNNDRFRYIYVPILLTVFMGILFAVSSFTVQAFALLLYWSWQAFHYGRQNTGIYAFASIAETGKAPRKAEKIAIELGTLFAILGTFKILGTAVAPVYLHQAFDVLYQVGLAAFIALAVFSAVVYAKYFRDTSLFKTLFFFTSVLFFVPIFLSTDNNIAFLSYAIAHGLQYIIFMTVISATTPDEKSRSLPYKSLATLLVLLLFVGFAFWRVADLREMEIVKGVWIYSRTADFLFGSVVGATMAHFLIDAGAWRLSMKKQRSYITKRFYFVFD